MASDIAVGSGWGVQPLALWPAHTIVHCFIKP